MDRSPRRLKATAGRRCPVEPGHSRRPRGAGQTPGRGTFCGTPERGFRARRRFRRARRSTVRVADRSGLELPPGSRFRNFSTGGIGMKARLGFATLALLALAAVATAQTPALREAARPRPMALLDASTRAEVLDSLIAEVLRNYVEADTARMIADLVRDRAKQGAYDGLTRPAELAEAVTSDLRRVNGDLHLSLRFDPEGGSSAAGRPTIVRTGAAWSAGGPGGPLVMRRGPGA